MPSAVLHIISASSSSPSIRQAAAVYLKNRILRSWTSGDIDPGKGNSSHEIIFNSDRITLQQNILHVLVSVPQQNVKVQLKTCLATMTGNDFLEKWPELLNTVITYIQSGDYHHIEGGLLALIEILKVWR